MKTRVSFKFEVLFLTLRESRKHNFPRRTSGLSKRVGNSTDSEMYLLADFCLLKIPLKTRVRLNSEVTHTRTHARTHTHTYAS